MRLIALLFGIFPLLASTQTTILFQPMLGAQALELDRNYVLSNGDTVSFSSFKMYVTHFNLWAASGKTHEESFPLLVDLEDSTSLVITSKEVNIKSIELMIGTDSTLNTAGVLEGDLDPIHGMYWAWNSGYINLKVEGHCSSLKNPRKEFEYHVGGYRFPYATAHQKKFVVERNAEKLIIEIDLKKWLDSFDFLNFPQLMIPGEKAATLADYFTECLKLTYE